MTNKNLSVGDKIEILNGPFAGKNGIILDSHSYVNKNDKKINDEMNLQVEKQKLSALSFCMNYQHNGKIFDTRLDDGKVIKIFDFEIYQGE